MAARYSPSLTLSVLRRAGQRPNTTALIYLRCPYRARPLHTSSLLRAPIEAKPDRPSPKTSSSDNGSTRNARAAPISLVVGGGLLASAIALFQTSPRDGLDKQTSKPPISTDNRDPSLPRFRLASIRDEHGGSSPHPWVTLEDKVYDITDWVAAHPGGEVILRAAGGSIEPYWNIFTIHKAPHIREILDQYLIGYIDVADLVDGKPALETIEDPFQQDPARDPRFIIHTAKPRNAEPVNEELLRSFRTPNGLFYIRNHMWVPVVDEARADDEFALTVELPDGDIKRYTLGELKAKFPSHKVTAVLQCSGNKRSDMTQHAGKTNGLQWGVGAISNAEWEGVRLADVLADAGLVVSDPTASTALGTSKSKDGDDTEEKLDPRLLHVQFSGLEAYAASIPLSKALDPSGDVLLAFGMNGAVLPRDHGFPLRAIVPGIVAARSVKWLSKVVVADEESHSQWQRRDYKSFGPNEGANPDWDRAVSIQEMPITSAITGVWVGDCLRKGRAPSWAIPRGANSRSSTDGNGVVDIPCPDQTPAEPVAIQGYAYSGGGRAIGRVDVSLDGGRTWDQAELIDDCVPGDENQCFGNKSWAWTRWRYTGQLPIPTLPSAASLASETSEKKFCTTLVVKATDEAYNSQPETHAGIYNVRGNLATAWHRVKICPTCISGENKSTTTGDSDKGRTGVRWSTGEAYGCGFGKEAVTGSGDDDILPSSVKR